ncbi:hypothetical protein ABPG75_004592 [Micractinium tetrahymenae]
MSAPQLDSLDDNLLLHIFSHLDPLPDLFNAAASCRRFRDLALDRRSWLYVTHVAAQAGAGGEAPRRRRSLQAAPSSASFGSPAAPIAGGAAAGGADPEEGPGAHWYRSQFSSLAAALAASRPGDTVLLEPGPVPHLVSSTLVVRHPVHILGGGAEAADCLVVGERGLEALLDFRASGRLANLTLRATAGACVAHSRGRLTVQACTLECDARGLPHLAAPLLTRAVSGPMQPGTPAGHAGGRPALPAPGCAAAPTLAAEAAAAAGAAAVLAKPGQKRPLTAVTPAAAGAAPALHPAKRLRGWLGAGAGVLSVVETRIRAEGLAVDLRGTGQLAGVRAIYSTGHALVWLEVDSANGRSSQAARGKSGSKSQGGSVPLTEAAPAGAADGGEAAAASSAGAPSPLPATPAPSWVATGFDAAAFQQKAAALAAALAAPGPGPGAQEQQQSAQAAQQLQRRPGQGGSMAQKAEEWCVLHHSSLSDRGEAPSAAVQR